MTAAKRATSIMLSAAMLIGSLLTPMTAYAQEAATEGNEVYEQPAAVEASPEQVAEETITDPKPTKAVPEKAKERTEPEQPVTEAPDYLVTVPY